MRRHRHFFDRLGIEHPIIQAPMAGFATPELAAAVSNAGGIGSLGLGEAAPEGIEASMAAVARLTNRAVNLNFFAHIPARPDAAREAAIQDRLRPYYAELGLGEPPGIEAIPEGFTPAKLAAALAARPAVVSFHFGLPDEAAMRALKEAGIAVMATATTVREAHVLAAAGCDAVIAQGWEAGGHRGAHAWTRADQGIGALALVPQVVDAIDLPVIAAGGIADGRGIAAAFALGAAGVQMGTAFLACPEASVPPHHRAAVRGSDGSDTAFTDAHSGYPARARRTRYTEGMAENAPPPAPFLAMYALSGPLRNAAEAAGRDDFSFDLYGQAAGLARELPAGELVARLVGEAETILAGLARPA
ncbi:nitronate monooxygenase [Limibaculum sp. FT325]|uniref:NAD(P)H-dependent flavin oxidoreductase n=1 Tax=Thermohalobaculum sediminis TaxID=2939436 RepID=UPI0020BF6852|nr:nitronate monooxygenase [Limibaculum sediminis]MCL5778475.1 nitronate monooxygenase [Limibaculum sediminis]